MLENIKLGMLIALLVFLFFGVVWGFLRGLRKTASRGIFLLIISIILIFLTPVITSMLANFPMTIDFNFQGIVVSGTMTIREALTQVIEGFAGTNPQNTYIVELIVTIPLLILNSFVYVILFWILKYLLYPLNYLFYCITFKPKKPKEVKSFSAFNEQEGETTPIEANDTPKNKKSKKQKNVEASEGKFVINDPEGTATGSAENNQAIEDLGEESQTPAKPKKKKIKKEKISKHRGLGALVGLAVGLVVMFNTLVPVYGAVQILKDANNLKVNNLTEESTSLDSVTNNLSTQILEAYNTSALHYASEYTGIEALGLTTFDYLTSATIDGTKISLREDIRSALDTVSKVDILLGILNNAQEVDGNKILTQEDLNALLTASRNVVNSAKNVRLINILTDYIIPVTSGYLAKNEVKITNNAEVDALVVELLNALSTSDINVFDEITSLLNLADYLSSQNVLLPIINNDLGDPIAILQGVSDDFGEQFTNTLFSIKTLNVALPHVLNIGFTYLDSAINFGYTKSEATGDQLKESFSDLAGNIVTFVRQLNPESEIYLTTNSLIPLGNVLDTLKNGNLFTEDTYDGLVDYGISQLKTLMSGLIPEGFQDVFNNRLLGNASAVTSWTSDMTALKTGLEVLRNKNSGILGEVVDGKPLRQGLSVHIEVREDVINNIGLALDHFESSKLLGNVKGETIEGDPKTYNATAVSSLLVAALNYADEELKKDISEEDNTYELLSILKTMSNNVIKSEHTYSPNTKFWENEFKLVSPLIEEVYSVLDGGELELTTTLGINLDQAKKGMLLGKTTTLDLMETAIDIVSDEILGQDFAYNDDPATQSVNDTIYELFDDIKNNLNSVTVKDALSSNNYSNKFWENELKSYIALKNIADNVDTITTMSETVDLADDLDIAYQSNTIPTISLSRTIARVVDDTVDTSATPDSTQDKINGVIGKIAIKLRTPDSNINSTLASKTDKSFWARELDYVDILTTTFSDDGDYQSINKLPDTGKILDNVTKGYQKNTGIIEYIPASMLIEDVDIRYILASSIDDIKSSVLNNFTNKAINNAVTNALTSIKNNFININETISYERELTSLKTLSDLELRDNIFNDDSADAVIKIVSIGATLDSIAFNTVESGSIKYFKPSEYDNSRVVSRSVINNLIKDALLVARIYTDPDETIVDDTKNVNKIIDYLRTSITTNNDYIYSWAVELAKIDNLVDLQNSNLTDDGNHDGTPDWEEYTEENKETNPLVILGGKIDSISFNLKTGITDPITNSDQDIYDDNIYDNDKKLTHQGTNSVVVTRQVLRDTVKLFIASGKDTDAESVANAIPTDSQDIVNELIDNVSNKIYTTIDLPANAKVVYTKYKQLFIDLLTVKVDMESKLDITDSLNLEDLDNLTAQSIDTMLNNIQGKLICGVTTTRKVAYLAIDGIYKSMDSTTSEIWRGTPAETYSSALRTHYSGRITSTSQTNEYYVCDDSAITSVDTNYANPFATLQGKAFTH